MKNPFTLGAQSTEKSVVTDKKTKYEHLAAAIICLLVSFATLAVCTRSSFLYPLNDWVDSNCYFTVGKSMFNGKVVYRDIYEQKGVLLYFIHGIAYLISNTTFIGVFIFEVIIFAAFLYISYLCARLFVSYALSLCFLPVMACSIMTSISLRQGDSAEEFCLPFLVLPIYMFLKSVKGGDGSGVPSTKEIILLGMGAACVLWIKYTLLGIYIGYVLCAVLMCITDKQPIKLFHCATAFITGVAIVSLPFLIYFALNGALGDLWEVYFYNNMFLYTDERTLTDKLAGIASLSVRGLSYNGLWGTLVYLGFFSLVLDIKHPRVSAGAVLLYIGCVFFIYWGGIGWYYYSFGMAALCVPGFVFIQRVVYYLYKQAKRAAALLCSAASEKSASVRSAVSRTARIFDSPTRTAVSYVLTATLVLSLGIGYTYECFNRSPNVFYMKYERDEIWQEKFARIINESDEQTLLNYSCLDLGLYTTANIVPSEKYFARLNIDLEDMKNSLNSSIAEQRTKYVVYRGNPSNFVLYYYKIVATEVSHLEYEGSTAYYHLLERRNDRT